MRQLSRKMKESLTLGTIGFFVGFILVMAIDPERKVPIAFRFSLAVIMGAVEGLAFGYIPYI